MHGEGPRTPLCPGQLDLAGREAERLGDKVVPEPENISGKVENKIRDVLDARPGEAVRDAAEDAARRAEELQDKAEQAIEDSAK